MSRKLKNYLRTYRLKSGLTQRDVAFLLSLDSSSTISRIEKNNRTPTATILLGYCTIFNAQPGDIAPGLLLDIETAVENRADVLKKRLEKTPESPLVLQRISFLESLVSAGASPRQEK